MVLRKQARVLSNYLAGKHTEFASALVACLAKNSLCGYTYSLLYSLAQTYDLNAALSIYLFIHDDPSPGGQGPASAGSPVSGVKHLKINENMLVLWWRHLVASHGNTV